MMTESIKKALIRYITRSATANDLNLLSKWITKSSNKKKFEAFIKDFYAITYTIDNPDTDRAIYKLSYAIKAKKKLVHRKKWHYIGKSVAAIFTIAILIGAYIFKDYFINSNFSSSLSHEIKTGNDKALLTLADGSEIQLGEKELFQTENFESSGTKLNYFKKNVTDTSKITFHYLTIPRGGKFLIKLSDGTNVWLNSDSRFKYPTTFKKGDSRQVELLYGEAYFDVSPATNNEGADFRVHINGQEVKVLGTEFNIKAYKEEENIYTTLVEGKVHVKSRDKNHSLASGQQTIFNRKKNTLTTKTINVYNETSWKDGVFSFDNKSLHEIMDVLSRWYNIDFEFINKETQNEKFMGVLNKNQEIEDILLQLKNSGVINSFKIEKYIIKIR